MRQRRTKIKKYLQLFKFAFLVKPYKSRLSVFLFFRWISLGAAMAMPLLTKLLIDNVISTKNWRFFTIIISGTIALMAVSVLSGAITGFLTTLIEEKTGYDLQNKVQKKWEKISYDSFRRTSVGDHLYRRSNDIQNIVHTLINTLPASLMSGVEFIVFFIIAAHLNLNLTLISIASIPFLILIEIFHSKYARPIHKNLQEISAEINDSLSQNILGFPIVKIFQREKLQTLKYTEKLARKIRMTFRKWRLDLKYQSLGWLGSAGWNLAVIFYGWALVMKGELTLGSLMALSIYLTRMTKPLENYASMLHSFVLGSVSAERILEILNAPEEEPGNNSKTIYPHISQAASPQLRLQNVEFGYSDNCPVLKSISCEFDSNKIIGITGPTGSGKTTIINLIMRFFKPWQGKIFLNGIDINSLPMRQLRGFISINPQDSFLFEGTIRENILYGNKNADEEEVRRVARMADIHDFIFSLKDGYDTMIGKDVKLSKGQSQKIAIARSFAKDSPIMVFDEGLSSLDVRSKDNILDLMDGLAKKRNKIIIFVDHDINTLMCCDTVLVLLNGIICEQGSPGALLSSGEYLRYMKMKAHYEGYAEKKRPAEGPPVSLCLLSQQ